MLTVVGSNSLYRDHREGPKAVESNNIILDALPAEDRRRLLPDLETVHLNCNEVIYEAEEPIRYVYFPLTSLVSVLAILEDGATVEVGMVGRHGMVGIAAILGATRASNWTVVQVGGEALRMEVRLLKEWFSECEPLNTLLTRYYRALVTQISQRAVCNARHMVMQRLCTWLLMVHDRLGSNHLPLTQDLISRRLGSRRASVTKAVNDLEHMGIIGHGRGYTTIVDRARLESFACECYQVISSELDITRGL